ncbi:MAG: TetR/AcrR family transcriptional regulator [Syntrophomonadales bacterium]
MQQERGKRERILEAAQSVFARKGYYLSKIEEIAELAGVGKGTVYEYFASKEELYKEMFKVILNRYTEYVMVEETPEMTVKEWIRHLLGDAPAVYAGKPAAYAHRFRGPGRYGYGNSGLDV